MSSPPSNASANRHINKLQSVTFQKTVTLLLTDIDQTVYELDVARRHDIGLLNLSVLASVIQL
jgi:hypothetical protein